MKPRTRLPGISMVITICIGIAILTPHIARAHCDTMDGPVVMDAKTALEKSDITPVLKWVKKEYESEIRRVFAKTLAVRSIGPEAGELADIYFFETLVRLHRAGEGAPYTGLKPAGTKADPAVEAADEALEDGSVDNLVKQVTNTIVTGIRQRFAHAIEKKKHAGESVEAGREFVEAYVEFVHYVERLHFDASSQAAHHNETEEASDGHHHSQ